MENGVQSRANAYNTSYTYDGLGNRLLASSSGQVTTSTYNAANQVLVVQPPTGTPTTDTYDANGNRSAENAQGTVTNNTWDGENRLVKVSSPSGVKTYTYNASGKRVINNTVAGLVTSTWDGENIIVESSSTSSLAGQYTDYPGWWGGLTQQHTGGSDQFYVFDPMGSTRYLVDSSNTVVKQYAFKAFGEQLVNTGSALSVFGYGGQVGYYQDASTRLYVRARHLDTGKGRWISRDPIGFGGGDWNLYRYVGNDPIILIDPTGGIPGSTHKLHKNPPIDPNTNCWTPLYTDYSQGNLKHVHQNYLKIYALFTNQLKSCVPGNYLNTLATAFTCIARAESNFDTRNHSPNHSKQTQPEPKIDNFGLMSLDPNHFSACGSGPICNDAGQVAATIHVMVHLCKTKNNVFEALYAFWGTVQGQSPDFANCISEHGISAQELRNIPCGCVSCQDCQRNWH